MVNIAAIGAAVLHHRDYSEKQERKKVPKPRHSILLEEYAELEVIVNKPGYFPGEIVKGLVNFRLMKKLPNNKKAKLMLKIKGMMIYFQTEKEIKEKNKNQAFPEKKVHQHIFYNHLYDVMLEEGASNYTLGTYVLPFEFKLHEKLPRTIKLAENDVNFTCFYMITAFWQIDKTQKIKYPLDLLILQKTPMLVMNQLSSKLNSEYRKEVCCMKKKMKNLNIEIYASSNILKNSDFPCFCKLKMENIQLKTLFFNKLEVKIIRLLKIEFRGIEKKFIETEVYQSIIDLTGKNTQILNPDTLKVDFLLRNLELPAASVENRYMRLVYVMTVKPAGLKRFEYERKAIVQNEAYLYFISNSDENLIQGRSNSLINEDNGDEVMMMLSKMPEIEKKESKKLEKMELVANLEKDLKGMLEEEAVTEVDG